MSKELGNIIPHVTIDLWYCGKNTGTAACIGRYFQSELRRVLPEDYEVCGDMEDGYALTTKEPGVLQRLGIQGWEEFATW